MSDTARTGALDAGDAISVLRRVTFIAAAFFVCIGEGACLGAAFAAMFFGWIDELRSAERRAEWGRWLSAVSGPGVVLVGAIGLWVVLGVATAWTTGTIPSSAASNKAITTIALGLGVLMVRRESLVPWRACAIALFVGAAIAIGAGLCQVGFGAFPGEHLLASKDRPWMGQLYIPGTMERALTGTLRNRMKMAEMLLFVLSTLGGLAVMTHRWRSRVALLGATALIAAAASLTYTVGTTPVAIAALAASLVLAFVPASRRGLGLGLAIAAALITILTVVGVTQAADSVLPPAGKWQTREWIWRHAWRIFLDHPWFGTGLGTYGKVSAPYFLDPATTYAFTLNSHHQHLTNLAEGGAVGFAAWSVLCVAVGVMTHRAWARDLDPRPMALLSIATTYVLASLVLSLVHDVLFHPVAALLFWWSVGVVVGRAQKPTGRKTNG